MINDKQTIMPIYGNNINFDVEDLDLPIEGTKKINITESFYKDFVPIKSAIFLTSSLGEDVDSIKKTCHTKIKLNSNLEEFAAKLNMIEKSNEKDFRKEKKKGFDKKM